MTYRVRYMPSVLAAIDGQVEYLLRQDVSVERASAWISDLYRLTESLEHSPRRHAVDETITDTVGAEIRKVVFGNYLIYYRVDDAHRYVDVVHFCHGLQETNRLTDDTD